MGRLQRSRPFFSFPVLQLACSLLENCYVGTWDMYFFYVKREKYLQEDCWVTGIYKNVSIHDCHISLCDSFALWAKSSLKFTLQKPKLGCIFLKIKSFLLFQIFQVAIAKTSMKKGKLNWVPPSVIISIKVNWSCQMIPRNCQHCFANGQIKKRCLISSCMHSVHITHSGPFWMVKCLLCIISLVFSPSTINSHKKDFEFHCHR